MGDAALPRGDVAAGCLAEAAVVPDIEELFCAHFRRVWRFTRRLGLSPADADDATQQVFMIASTKLDCIAAGKERAFLHGIALKVVSRTHRAKRRRHEAQYEPPHEFAAPSPGPHDQAELRQACQLLDELLCRLPDKLRRVLVLAELEEFEIPDIALLERIPVGTAASRLRRARRRFRGLLLQVRARNPFGGPP